MMKTRYLSTFVRYQPEKVQKWELIRSLNIEELNRRFPDTTDQKRHFLVTEVTAMKSMVCVATIDLQTRRIARPLQWNHDNWPASLVDNGLRPGSVVRQKIRWKQDPKGQPHQTEDTQLTNMVEIIGEISNSDLYTTLAPLADASVDEIFHGCVVDAQYVVDGSNCRSLGSVLVAAHDLDVVHNSYGAIRVNFTDKDDQRYSLKATDCRFYRDAAKTIDSTKRQIALAKKSAAEILIRVGLARGWDGKENAWNPKRCYLQANGLIFNER